MASSDKRTQIYLPEAQYRDLQSLARQRQVSMACIVREALAEYATAHPAGAYNLDVDPLADLIGCFEDDETLSTAHDDHLYPKK
ncbi:MAG: CopG family transcriptional regulator [Candidatus Wallbacteria bacterium]|nr:CopG family transcriptional regulator [Candidatus Wallbacteria bacterium]